jgi:hypothetical protein
MTRNIAVRFPDVQEEASLAFAEFIPATNGAIIALFLQVYSSALITLHQFNRMDELSRVEHFIAGRNSYNKSVLCGIAFVYVNPLSVSTK